MKKYFLISAICLLSITVKAEKDSCINVIIDSCDISIDSILVIPNSESKLPTKENNTTQFKQPKNTSKSSDIFDFVRDVIDALLPPVWGLYEEDGQRSEGPYFLFDRKEDGAAYVQKQMDSIRARIRIAGSKEREIYFSIFTLAGTSSISSCDDADKFCSNTSRAKASAFVYLVGLDGSGYQLDSPDFHGPIRQGYRSRALAFLNNVNAPGLNNLFDLLSYTGIGLLTDYIAAAVAWNKAVDRSAELQTICQTWDMLRWCYNIDSHLPNDDDIHANLVNAGNRIIDEYVVPLHRRAQHGIYQIARNNYTLIIGSALASSAICFHDYGARFIQFDRMPYRWANSAYYNIHNTMWKTGGLYFNSMSKAEGRYGYSEGTYYFQFAFLKLMPMFLARVNFAPENKVVSYNSYVLDPFPNYVRNFWYDKDYHNLYKWYNNLVQSNGKAPVIDESYSDREFNTPMAILRNTNNGKPYVFNCERGALFTDVGYSLREDYLAALTQPVKLPLPQSIQMPSGDIVIRNRPKDELDSIGKPTLGKHYIYINAETGNAANGGWHEQSTDFASFIITCDSDILMMTPPLYSDGASYLEKTEQHNTLTAFEFKSLVIDFNNKETN